ncbi:16S rRNA (uracil(1498)-N(3))-methyltransferase [Pseudolysinimonas sp.]|jgi:16S rRNA (uracil1498-N3)-methyltransferase|uniref:16S rRNA (uracil(1498)-N(3))-methyltransferase n=1 Tax=Pseudolysinimonas sp. TaxID=2680009 RepID=UPI00378489A5
MASLYLSPSLGDAVAGSVVTLGGDEGRHAITVARVRVGETLSISDGAGLVVTGPVASIEGNTLTLTVEAANRHPAPAPELWLAQALAKGDRDELAIQAATELGATGVIPWAAERSITRWEGAKVEKGRERWASIVREATKQSIRPWVPVVDAIATTASLTKLPGLVLVLEPTAAERLTEVDLDAERITLVVGPEGGVSPRELDTLAVAGARAVRLGPEVLRTSTAGPAALAVLNAKLGRW